MIILFGVVGSGKSEQAKLLMSRLNCPHVSTSRLLKEKSKPEYQETMKSGKLIGDEKIFKLLETKFTEIDAANREFVLDGAPRSVGQAEWIDRKIKNGQLKLTAIIYLRVPKEVVLQRLMARGREDDKEDVIARRFRQYDEVTTPVLEYFRTHDYPVSSIDGIGTLQEVQNRIWQAVKDKVDAPQER